MVPLRTEDFGGRGAEDPPPLEADDVHVWPLRLDPGPSRLQALRSWLSADERERAGRFYFGRDRDRFVAGRGQLREVLARYLRVPPSAVAFSYGPQGKPRLAGDGRLRFNLSHSEDRALLGVARRELGIDLERIRPTVDYHEIARYFFSSEETATLMGLPSAGRARAFFAFWTYKEAFIKAKGGGLGIQLADFDVCVEPDGLARLTRTAWDPEETGRWSLRALPAPPGFAAAIAIERRLAHVIVVPASHLRSAARRER